MQASLMATTSSISTAERPKIAAEIRAWIGVAVVLMAYGVSMAWWAATITTEVREMKGVIVKDYAAVREELKESRAQLRDLENRLRVQEIRSSGFGKQ